METDLSISHFYLRKNTVTKQKETPYSATGIYTTGNKYVYLPHYTQHTLVALDRAPQHKV